MKLLHVARGKQCWWMTGQFTGVVWATVEKNCPRWWQSISWVMII